MQSQTFLPEQELLVTDKSAIIMPDGALAKPGDIVQVKRFAKHMAQLQILVDAGNLTLSLDTVVTGVDTERTPPPPPLPVDMDLKTGKGVLRSRAGGNEGQVTARLNQIKANAEAEKKRLAAIAEIGADAELSPEEAKELGLLRS